MTPPTLTYSRKAAKRRQRTRHSSDDSDSQSPKRPRVPVRVEVTVQSSSSTPVSSSPAALDDEQHTQLLLGTNTAQVDVCSSRTGSKRPDSSPTHSRSNSTQEQFRTRIRPPSPLGPVASAHPSRPQANHASRTPVKSATSLPALSPLTPLPATPLKRTSTHPMDHVSTPTKSKQSADPLSKLFDLPRNGSRREISQSLRSMPRKPIARRMLGRTRTEPLIDDDPSIDAGLDSLASKSSSNVSVGSTRSQQPSHVIDMTASVSSLSQTSTFPEEQSQSLAPGPSTATLQQSGLRTYAGRSRSFLVELPTDSNPDSRFDADDLTFDVRESYKDLRMRWGVDNSEDDPRLAVSLHPSPEPESGRKGKGKAKDRPKAVLPPNMMNDLKSVTELRSRGESRRFMDEVGYLFEGMDQTVGVRVRRGSALELVTKLCDTDFARRAKATDFRSRAWDALRASGAGDGDKVLDAILVLFAALVTQSPHEMIELTQKEEFTPVLWDMLTMLSKVDSFELVGSGINEVELKKAGIGKAEKLSLIALRSVIVNKSELVSDEERPSLRRLLSQALASLPPSVHRPGNLEALYSTLLAALSPLSPRLSGYTTGLPLLPDPSEFTQLPGVPQFDHIANCLDILDSFLLGRWATVEEQSQICHDLINGNGQEVLAEGLATLCAVCNIILRNGEFEDIIPIANRCLESAFRVLINISHHNPTWSALLVHQRLMIPVISSLIVTAPRASHDTTDEAGEGGAQAFDRQCLALGLLTNLVQEEESSKQLCRETKLDPSCPALRQCAYACTCPNAISVLECLASVYEQHLRVEDDDPGTYIIRGHLAVLFGLLMRDSPTNQDIILDVLPGAGLKGLIRHAREFVGLYAEFMARVARGERHDAEDANDDSEEGIPQIQVKDGATQDVAQDIIEFLEGLMDA